MPTLASDMPTMWGVLISPNPTGSIICQNGLQNSETFTDTNQCIIKDVSKDADEQLHDDVHRVRSGRVPSAGAAVPMSLGCAYVHQPTSFPNPAAEGS